MSETYSLLQTTLAA